MARFCSNCGKPVNDDIKFCPDCGNELDRPVSDFHKEPSTSQTNTQTNGYAIVGFILAFAFALLGLIFSIIALNKAEERNGAGRGLAIAGIVISILNMIWGAMLYSGGI